MDDVLAAVLAHLDEGDPAGVVGLYLYGSGAERLRADSDIDLLLVTRESLTLAERTGLVALLVELSGWRGHARLFPEAAERRPIDLTSLVVGRMQTEPGRAQRDFQYGEWMRPDVVNGLIPQPTDDPDVSAPCRHCPVTESRASWPGPGRDPAGRGSRSPA